MWSADIQRELDSLEEDDRPDMKEFLRFVRNLIDHLAARFPDEDLREWRAFDMSVLRSGAAAAYEEAANLDLLCQRYGSFLNLDPDSASSSVADAVKAEYVDFRFIIEEKQKQNKLNDFPSIVKYMQSEGTSSLLQTLFAICSTFQASSADCERGFSLMNRIKTKGRNRLECAHLEALMMIKSYRQDYQIDLNEVVAFWKKGKDRRERGKK